MQCPYGDYVYLINTTSLVLSRVNLDKGRLPMFFTASLKSAISLSSIDTKYYSIDIRMAAVVSDNRGVDLCTNQQHHPVCQNCFVTNDSFMHLIINLHVFFLLNVRYIWIPGN
jgi:hypothetical protein